MGEGVRARESVIAGWGGRVRITSIKITDQISIELKQTRTREGHYIMYCVDFFSILATV